MIVPVFWVSRHDDILARGYADEGLLEAILDRSLWRVPGGVDFEHHEVRGDEWPEVEGAVVILPARHHVNDVEWFKERLDALKWSVIVFAGDEEWTFPVDEFPESATRRVWVMQPRPEHEHLSGLIPGGWSPGTRESLATYREDADKREFSWAFLGQVRDNKRRQQCVGMLKRLSGGMLLATDGYMQGVPIEEYRRYIASAKVIPCPSGPFTVDTNRHLEAMEAGSIPICDMISPNGPKFDYWKLVFGEGHPLPTTMDWSHAPTMIRRLARNPAFVRTSNRIYSFWQQKKRDWAYAMDRDIRAVANVYEVGRENDDWVTAIVTTSPTESNPDTSHIETTISSIREQLPRAEIVVVADGVRPEQEHLRGAYDQYLRRLLWLTNFEWPNVLPVLMPEWSHQANCVRKALEYVTTPQVLFVEHDTPLIGGIDWWGLCGVIDSGVAEAIRFHIDETIHKDHKRMMLDLRTVEVESWDGHKVPLRRTFQWWQRPHLAATELYRDKIMPLFPETSRSMIEDHLYGVIESNIIDNGPSAWDRWKLWVYTPPGGFKRSGHLDARGDAPKYDMWI